MVSYYDDQGNYETYHPGFIESFLDWGSIFRFFWKLSMEIWN